MLSGFRIRLHQGKAEYLGGIANELVAQSSAPMASQPSGYPPGLSAANFLPGQKFVMRQQKIMHATNQIPAIFIMDGL